MTELIQPALTVIGAFIASYFGVRMSIVRLEENAKSIQKEIDEKVNPRLDLLGKRSHDQQNEILRHDGRLMVLESRDRK